MFGFSIAALFVCNRLKIPGIVGYLFAGLLIGPSGLRLVTDTEMIGRYAELGVILLLFTIGLEISFRELLTARRMLVLGGALQLLLTGGAVVAAALLLGLAPPVAVVFGMMIAISSTTIVMSALGERGETGSPHGRFLLSVLIFQDLAVVPFMLLLPLLAGEAPLALGGVPLKLLQGGVVLAAILISLRWGVPALLYQAARVRSSEVFLFSVVGICVLTVYVAGMLGLSFAFGAFLAGLLIADSEFRHEALTLVLPFRDIFAGLFFVSIGMLLEIDYLLANPLLVGGLTLGIIVVKALFGMLSARALGLSVRPVVIGGLSLAHVGEFSFVIATAASSLGVLSAGAYQLFLNAAVLSMAAAPFLIQLSRAIGDRLAAAVPQRGGEQEPSPLADHLVIIGYGLSGRKIARIARESGIAYTVIEANPETVRHELAAGEPILFGDAAHPGVLRSAGADRARALVCVISDPGAVERIVRAARAVNPELFIAVRVRYAGEVEKLRESGADEVIAEEFEALIEIVARVLSVYMVPFNEIEGYVDRVRADGYAMFRSLRAPAGTGVDAKGRLYDLDIRTYRVASASPLAGLRLEESGLRDRYGATVLAVRREGGTITNPPGDQALLPGDVVVLIGSPSGLSGVGARFSGAEEKK
ncbi:MAG: cation:proton antiporter [Methanospirillum sp.]